MRKSTRVKLVERSIKLISENTEINTIQSTLIQFFSETFAFKITVSEGVVVDNLLMFGVMFTDDNNEVKVIDITIEENL